MQGVKENAENFHPQGHPDTLGFAAEGLQVWCSERLLVPVTRVLVTVVRFEAASENGIYSQASLFSAPFLMCTEFEVN